MSGREQPRQLLSRSQVIALLGVSDDWADRNFARLRRDHGFPAPLLNRKYDPAAIARWQDRQSGLDANAVRHSPPPGTVANDDDQDEIRRAQEAMDRIALGRQ